MVWPLDFIFVYRVRVRRLNHNVAILTFSDEPNMHHHLTHTVFVDSLCCTSPFVSVLTRLSFSLSFLCSVCIDVHSKARLALAFVHPARYAWREGSLRHGPLWLDYVSGKVPGRSGRECQPERAGLPRAREEERQRRRGGLPSFRRSRNASRGAGDSSPCEQVCDRRPSLFSEKGGGRGDLRPCP